MAGASLLPALPRPSLAALPHYGVLVYGGTPSGIMAAYAAAREGLRVALVLGPNPLGGMMANGLGASDAPNLPLIGGLALDFFNRIAKHYGLPKAERRFEPNVAFATLKGYVIEAEIDLYTNSLAIGFRRNGPTLTALSLNVGLVLRADFFIDASYEGDLMPLAGVTSVWGREAQKTFNERAAGYNQFPSVRSIKARDTAGRLLPGVKPLSSQVVGSADKGVQAYTFRLCLSNDPKNKAPWRAPPGYNPNRYALDARRVSANSIFIAGALHNGKFDRNGNQPGASWPYPRGDRAARSAITHDHHLYMAGLMYFWATDPSVHPNYREQVNSFGLALDEFTAAGNWPRQLYIRSASRLRGRYIFQQKDTQTELVKKDSIGIGSYSLDCHAAQYQETVDGRVNFEGSVPRPYSVTSPYEIPYRILTPHVREATNLLVSVCVSATHIAIASLRMEPQYMIMGEAAGVAAAIAAQARSSVQAISVGDLQTRLRRHGAILAVSQPNLRLDQDVVEPTDAPPDEHAI